MRAPAGRATRRRVGPGRGTRRACHGPLSEYAYRRFSTLRHADRIWGLEHGRVIELGTHGDLMARGGPYAELYRIQAAAYG